MTRSSNRNNRNNSGNGNRTQNSNYQNTRIQIDNDMLSTSTLHTNIAQEVIITTEDKIKLALIEHMRINKAMLDWLTPFSIGLSAAASLSTAEFKDQFSVSAETWKAIFIIILIASTAWFLFCIGRIGYYLVKNKGKSDFVETLKKSNQELQNSAVPASFSNNQQSFNGSQQ